MSPSVWSRLPRLPRLPRLTNRIGLLIIVAFIVAEPAFASTTSSTSMPWETPLQTIEDSLSGPVAKAIGIIAIIITGLGFAVSESGSVIRKGMGIVCGLAVALTATTFITSLFSLTSGVVF